MGHAPGSSAQDKCEKGIDCSFERTNTLLRLGQEKSSLERGEQSDGEIVGVDVGREPPVGMKSSEPIADRGRPLFEPGGDEGSGLGGALSELTAERTEGAASPSLCVPRLRDHHVPPRSKPFDAAEIRVPLVVDDGLGLKVDDRLYEFLLVGKVVVKLRTTDFDRCLDVIEGGACD